VTRNEVRARKGEREKEEKEGWEREVKEKEERQPLTKTELKWFRDMYVGINNLLRKRASTRSP
jgi:hypothetical protein